MQYFLKLKFARLFQVKSLPAKALDRPGGLLYNLTRGMALLS